MGRLGARLGILAAVADELDRSIAGANIAVAGAYASRNASGAVRYYHDPSGFVREAIAWPAGHQLADYQGEALDAITQHHRVSVRGPRGLGKCLALDEPVRLADGSIVRAGDLVGRSFSVLAVEDMHSGRVVVAPAHAADNGIEPVVRITTDKGRVIVRTLNHPLWADRTPYDRPCPEGRGRPRPEGSWVPAGELSKGAAVATYLGNEGAVETASIAELTVLGALIADGGLTGKTAKFSQAPGPMLDAMRSAVAELGCELVYAGNVDYRIARVVRRNRWAANPIWELCQRWNIAGHSALEKRLPDLVWRLGDEGLALLLNRMFACDGWAHAKDRPGEKRANREIGYGTSCPGLAQDVQRALLRLGITAEMRKRKVSWTHLSVKKHGYSYTVAIHDIPNIRRFIERVGILGKEEALENLAHSCDRASQCMVDKWRSYKLPPGFAWEKVKSVEVLPPQPTVAISVPGPNTFLTDFVEHNTALEALAILWFAATRDAAGVDWKIGTTAGAYSQLQHFLWPEIHKWARRIRWDVLERKPWSSRTELLTMHIKLRYGEAFAASVDNPYLIEGAHADSVMFVFDESKAITTAVFNSVEGTFSNADTAGREAFALAMSTPGEPAGFFYNIHTRRAGTEQWWARHVSRDEAIAAGQLSAKWCEERRADWGEDSQLYNNHVLGQFWSADEDGVIPLSWVEAAIQRWHAWKAEGGVPPVDGFKTVGVDVARQGSDDTVLAIRHGDVVTELRRSRREDTMATTGRVKAIVDKYPDMIPVVDVIGIGAGVVDRLREMGVRQTIAFNASEGTKRKDRSGEMGFSNARSNAWWSMRETLAPHALSQVALPPDDMLIGDLTTPRYRAMSGGKIQVESKDDIKKRLGRSTDTGDAVIQSFWPISETWAKVYGVISCGQCRRPFMTDINPERCPHCKTVYQRESVAA